MADTEAKKILAASELWGEDGDRTDPDDSSLTPPVIRKDGWPSTFSTENEELRRPVHNQLYREVNGGVHDLYRYGGVLPYDAEINYPRVARCFVAGTEYSAVTPNGPDTTVVSPADNGQTAWETVQEVVTAPHTPVAPRAATPVSGELDWFWPCPRDGGAVITAFEFRWRLAGQTEWSTPISLSFARYVQTGIENAVAIQAQIRAGNQSTVSPRWSSWSPIGSATPTATKPEGGAQLALLAEHGNGEASLNWLEPDDGGVEITGYLVQWRSGTQQWSTARERTVTSTDTVISGLRNFLTYRFRVRAINSRGDGPWSTEVTARPQPPPGDPGVPDVAAAPLSVAGQRDIFWYWRPPSDNGAAITAYEFRSKLSTSDTWGAVATVTTPFRRVRPATLDEQYDAQVRAVNAHGRQTTWSATGTGQGVSSAPDMIQHVGLRNTESHLLAYWGVPELNGSTGLTYEIQVASDAAFPDEDDTETITALTATTYQFNALTDGTTYWVRVRARTSAGAGQWSPAASIVRNEDGF